MSFGLSDKKCEGKISIICSLHPRDDVSLLRVKICTAYFRYYIDTTSDETPDAPGIYSFTS